MAGDNAIVVINGQAFDGWTSFSIEQSFDEASGSAELVFTDQPDDTFPIHVGDAAQIILAGVPALTGNVKEVANDHSWQQHEWHAQLRDATQDFIQSTIGPGNSFKPPVTLKQVLDRTLKRMGLSKIKVIDDVHPQPYGAAEVVAGSIDDRGFIFGDMWAQKRQVVLNTDGKGNLVIARNKMDKRAATSLVKMYEDGPLNNILSAKYRSGDNNRSNETSAATQKSTNDTKHWEGRPKGDPDAQADKLATHWGRVRDSAIRPELKMHFRGGRGLAGVSPEKAASWVSNVAKARDYEYSATVQGFTMGLGQLWWPGFLVPVIDQHRRINAELFITKVRFTKDYKGGALTEITCAPKEAFSDKASGSAGDTRTSDTGAGDPETGTYDGEDGE